MNLSNLNEVLKSEPAYRIKQVKKLIYSDLIENWKNATTLPTDLRKKLAEQCPLSIGSEIFISSDKRTIKTLITFIDDLKAETVLMRYDKRNTICVSSQIGCPLGCKFCATGKMGFKRNLQSHEIVEQALFFARHLKKENSKVTNAVFMGMGEPFLNYENVIGAIKILNDKEGFGLRTRHISVSTVGITEGIKKLSEEKIQVNLAISLNACHDKLRSDIIPFNKKYSIKKIFKATGDYIKKTGKKVILEYVMIKDINDSNQDAEKLASLAERHFYVVNLILYNPTGIFKPSPKSRVVKFKEILIGKGVNVTERYRFGKEIKAACGQLAHNNEQAKINAGLS